MTTGMRRTKPKHGSDSTAPQKPPPNSPVTPLFESVPRYLALGLPTGSDKVGWLPSFHQGIPTTRSVFAATELRLPSLTAVGAGDNWDEAH